MLISFSVENWMSFRDKASFSMVASRERQHKDRLPHISKYKTRVLPVAAIYGGNASGKSNFFKALRFVQTLIVKGTQPDSLILVEPFRLDDNMVGQPSRFSFELLIDEIIYEFSFAVTRNAVLEEKLVQINNTSEKVLYNRQNSKINFDVPISTEEKERLKFVFEGTRDNQLFLTNSVSQKVDIFRPVYNWFKYTLELIAPNSRYNNLEQFLDTKEPIHAIMNAILSRLDTGILHMEGKEMPLENIPFFEDIKSKFLESNKKYKTAQVDSSDNERFVVTSKNGELIAQKMVTYHRKTDGQEVMFEFGQESDGTKRVIDLLPAFINTCSICPDKTQCSNKFKVYFIDEVDRSLHTLLTRQLIMGYLNNSKPESRSQLLFTTHDVMLMDQDMLRRDEMWVTERDDFGASQLIPFSDYKDVRYDKDIRKSYLQGRLGGVPRILMGDAFVSSCREGKGKETI